MLLSLQTQFPETWRDTFQLLAAGFTWVLGLPTTVLNLALIGPFEQDQQERFENLLS